MTNRVVPSAVWPTADRDVRESVCAPVKPSPASGIATPSRTSAGPPPIASVAFGGSPVTVAETVTFSPSGYSDTSVGPAAPTPVSTQWPAPIVDPPPDFVPVTVPVRATFGTSGPAWSRRMRTS